MSDPQQRRRWISLGETVAVCALIVSALGVWISWQGTDRNPDAKEPSVVERKQPIALVLRGRVEADGRKLIISPVENGHALESATLTIAGAKPLEVGSDGELNASDVQAALKNLDKDKAGHSVPVSIAARYVEAGTDRRGGGRYVLRYRWEGGGLFGGRSLRLTGLSRG
jgi:hypothetical protein